MKIKKIFNILFLGFAIILLNSCHNSLQEIDNPKRKIEYVGTICKDETISLQSKYYTYGNTMMCLVVNSGLENNVTMNFCKKNYTIVMDNGFSLDLNEKLYITVIMLGIQSYYIVSLKSENVDFLTFEEGYENLKMYCIDEDYKDYAL